MKLTVQWKNETYPNYYYDTEENMIFRKPKASGYTDGLRESININDRRLSAYRFADEDTPVRCIRDKYGKLVCNINGKQRRLDWLIAYTAYGNPRNVLRLIHLDGDPDNFDWTNLKWITQEDIIQEYKDIYHVESVWDIPEEWKEYTAPNNPNVKYMVSNFGNVTRDGELLDFGIDNDGYLRTSYLDEVTKDTKCLFLHRMVGELFVNNPNPEEFNTVNHIDGDKMNCCFWNLEWTTLSGNRDHATLNSLYKGKVYSEEMIEELCKALSRGVSVKEICSTFGVTPKFVSAIYTRKRWTSVSDKYVFPNNRLSYETKQKVAQLIADGKKGREIAEQLGLDYTNRFISLYERTRRRYLSEMKQQ